MENKLLKKDYIHNFTSPKDALRRGFHWSYFYDAFVYDFPVYTDLNDNSLLVCQLIVSKNDDGTELENNVTINVRDKSGTEYAPFHQYNDGYKELVEDLNKSIIHEMKTLGIKEKKEKGKKKKKIKVTTKSVWHSVEDGFPKEDGIYFCTIKTGADKYIVKFCEYIAAKHDWYLLNSGNSYKLYIDDPACIYSIEYWAEVQIDPCIVTNYKQL